MSNFAGRLRLRLLNKEIKMAIRAGITTMLTRLQPRAPAAARGPNFYGPREL